VSPGDGHACDAMHTSDGSTRESFCGKGPYPIPPRPREPVVYYTEVFVPPPTRLDDYMGIGALLGLGAGEVCLAIGVSVVASSNQTSLARLRNRIHPNANIHPTPFNNASVADRNRPGTKYWCTSSKIP